MKKTLSALTAYFLLLTLPSFALAAGNNAPSSCAIGALHPTQISVGMLEVKDKKHEIKKMSSRELDDFELKNPEPSVMGPGGKLYIIDHHHLARALYEAGVNYTYCTVLADLSNMTAAQFWAEMRRRNWVYPYDEDGNGPLPYSSIPANVGMMTDDPYRSFAAAVRKAGGYDKTDKPFAEFKWADYFRPLIKKGDLENHFDRSVKDGVKLAHSSAASGLPGYQGR